MTATGLQSQNTESKLVHFHALSLGISSIHTCMHTSHYSAQLSCTAPAASFMLQDPKFRCHWLAWLAPPALPPAWAHRAQERPSDHSQKNPKQNKKNPKQVFPNLCPSPLQELWCLGFFFSFNSSTSPSEDLTLVTYEHPLLSSVCSSVNPEQFGSVCIHLNAYLYIKVSLF